MVRINCVSKLLDHSLTAGAVAAVVVKFGHSFAYSPFIHLGTLQAGLVAATIALVGHAVEDLFKHYGVLDRHETGRKILAYSIGFVAGGVGSVGIAWLGLTSASVSILGCAILAGVAYGMSRFVASAEFA